MGTMILTVVTIFFALVGLANLIAGTERWLGASCLLTDCLLVVTPGENPAAAEARLTQAAELVEQSRALCGVRLLVYCPPAGEAGEIAGLFCTRRGIPLATSWQELQKQMENP